MLGTFNYLLILAAVCTYAFLWGRGDERLAALICLAATGATHGLMLLIGETYSRVETGLMLVDLFTLFAFIYIALRSDRFWPMWIAGLQLTTLTVHFLKAVHLDLLPQAYAAAAKFWVYPIFLIIVVGTWRGHRRRTQARRLTAA
jgi:hypothetical protein